MQSILQELSNAQELESRQITYEEVAAVLPSPNALQSVLQQVRLEPEDIPTTDGQRYRSMWNFFFVNREWFFYENNGRKLLNVFPAFAVVEFQNSPFHMSTPNETIGRLNSLCTTHLTILPFRVVKKNNIVFIGSHFNKHTTFVDNFSLSYRNVLVHMIAAYGYYQTYENYANAYLQCCTDLWWFRSATPKNKKHNVLSVFKACQEYLFAQSEGVSVNESI